MKQFLWLGFLLGSSILSSAAYADEQKPLLQAGKKTLYQRVLTYPGCELSDKIATKGKEQPAFSRFYVYQRQTQGATEWLHVGPDQFGKTSGWMKADCTSEWKMQLTLAMTNPQGAIRPYF